ncbi:uncharacterized protein LOC124699037 [Lolium rigidum]|uniref:uncharacterized protein LOC124699037 n=1 Tax=Lolium rigidum TaxID=89674 RepID=UPI001F5C6C5E|nr:uncharacterized protein LOC124699037 [Lolium rigidum]
MTYKMEPVLNPEYPETTETCTTSSSLLISISCRMLLRLMEDGWLAAWHGLGHRHQYNILLLQEPTSKGRTASVAGKQGRGGAPRTHQQRTDELAGLQHGAPSCLHNLLVLIFLVVVAKLIKLRSVIVILSLVLCKCCCCCCCTSHCRPLASTTWPSVLAHDATAVVMLCLGYKLFRRWRMDKRDADGALFLDVWWYIAGWD